MTLIAPLIVAMLFAAGIHLILKKHIFEIVLGTMVLSHGTNLLILCMGGWRRESRPPILPEGQHLPVEVLADPVPQALILTAIVIGFAVTALLLVMMVRTYEATGNVEAGEAGPGEDEQ